MPGGIGPHAYAVSTSGASPSGLVEARRRVPTGPRNRDRCERTHEILTWLSYLWGLRMLV